MKSARSALFLLAALVCAARPALAAEPAANDARPAVLVPADANEARALARELHERAGRERKAAEARFKTDEAACESKFLVNSCREDAKKTRNAALIAARRPEAEAREIERTLRQRKVDEHDAQQREEGPRREQEAREQAERNKADQEQALRRIERRQAEHAAKETGTARP